MFIFHFYGLFMLPTDIHLYECKVGYKEFKLALHKGQNHHYQ